MKVKVIEVQGRSHTLTQADGNTFRLFARESKVIDEGLISNEFHAQRDAGNIIITPVVEHETTKKTLKEDKNNG